MIWTGYPQNFVNNSKKVDNLVWIDFFFDSFNLNCVVCSLESYSSANFLMPWIMVEWSLPPSKEPMESSGISVMVLQRYMAICLGLAISLLLFFEIIWSSEIWKCSETTSMISWGVISLGLSGVIIFWSSFLQSPWWSLFFPDSSKRGVCSKLPLIHGCWI